MYYILGKWPSFPGGKKRLKTSLGQEMYYVCLGRDRIKLDRVPISVTMVVDFLSQGYKIGFVKSKFVGIFFFQTIAVLCEPVLSDCMLCISFLKLYTTRHAFVVGGSNQRFLSV